MGVTYDIKEKKFVFDFEHDGSENVGLSIQRAVDCAHKKINLYHYGHCRHARKQNKD